MGLKEVFKSAATTILKASGNVKKSVTFRQITPGGDPDNYDPTTGTRSNVYTDLERDAIVGDSWSQSGIVPDGLKIPDGDTHSYSQKHVIVEFDEVTITAGDLVLVDGFEYKIAGQYVDPVEATLILYIYRLA